MKKFSRHKLGDSMVYQIACCTSWWRKRWVISGSIIGLVFAVCACLQRGYSGEESAAHVADHVAISGREELARLTGKVGVIRDVSETVTITGPKPMPDLTFRHSYSKALELARIENALPGGHAIIYFVDEHNRRVRAQVGKDFFALDPETSERWLSVQNLFAGAADVNNPPHGEVYLAGTDAVHDRVCALFLVALRGGIRTKLWIGLEDGILYRKEDGGEIYDFRDVKMNTGLDKEFLGGNIASNGLPVISQRELNALLLREVKGGH